MVLRPLFAVLWVRAGPRAPSVPVKFGLGLVPAGLSYVMLVVPAVQPGKCNPLWLFGGFAVITVGEILLSPVGLSVTTQLAPAAFVTQMMGLWPAPNAAAGHLGAGRPALRPGACGGLLRGGGRSRCPRGPAAARRSSPDPAPHGRRGIGRGIGGCGGGRRGIGRRGGAAAQAALTSVRRVR
ncbi:POT-type proton-dependent oligopeptide transporter [Streptomyces sp. NBC_01795]|uniref:POT-type proton-dependent oligopeptide transporter n=1 Tax=Streptomyces sp. NBC_01795 TaxID=2975943 RepID=UPI003FA39098